jgi:subtilisin family serine protease
MSLGKYFVSRSLSYWFRRLLENDILVVAAAGNDDTDTPNYPGAYSPVLSVCATSEPTSSGGRGEFAKASFSNFGAWVDICAPGYQILSTLPGGSSGALSGTSMATPFVAGAAGHLKSLFPTLTGTEIADRLMKYSNAVSLYHGVATTNTMNRLYEGWFPDGTQYFLLGAGMLDLGSAATEGQHCWSAEAKTPADCVSFAYSNRSLGYLSQMNGGCVVSSVANTAHPLASAMASMPFVMLQVGALFSLVKRLRRRPKK